MRDIANRCAWHRLTGGEQVFDRHTDTLDVYFVIGGMVRVFATGTDGNEVALADIPAGNYFGGLAAIDGLGRSARVVATLDERVTELSTQSDS